MKNTWLTKGTSSYSKVHFSKSTIRDYRILLKFCQSYSNQFIPCMPIKIICILIIANIYVANHGYTIQMLLCVTVMTWWVIEISKPSLWWGIKSALSFDMHYYYFYFVFRERMEQLFLPFVLFCDIYPLCFHSSLIYLSCSGSQ